MTVTDAVVAVFKSGAVQPTFSVAAAVTAGRVVEINGNRTVQHAGAASLKAVGVALQTSDGTTGDKIAVATGGVFLLTASGAIAAGDQVITAATGLVATLAAAAAATAGDINNARAIVGTALEAIANGQQGRVLISKLGG